MSSHSSDREPESTAVPYVHTDFKIRLHSTYLINEAYSITLLVYFATVTCNFFICKQQLVASQMTSHLTAGTCNK